MERKYIIPLRKEWLKVPIYLRSRKAVKATRKFLQKHMKVDDVKLGKYLNLKLWERGNRNPPHKIEVVAEKIEDKEKGVYVFAELPGAPKEEKKEVKKKGLAAKLKDKLAGESEKDLEKKPVEDLTKKEVAKVEEKLMEKEEPKLHKKAPAKKEKEKVTKKSVNEKVREERLVKRDMKK